MVQEHSQSDQELTVPARRGRGPSKPFPLAKFEDVLSIAKVIFNEGVGDELRRLTVFDRLGPSPSSGASRNMVTTSSRYGLTTGGYNADHLTLTEVGKAIVSQDTADPEIREKIFECAIGGFDIFNQLYERLKSRRLPALDVLRDQFIQLGLNGNDCRTASDIAGTKLPRRSNLMSKERVWRPVILQLCIRTSNLLSRGSMKL